MFPIYLYAAVTVYSFGMLLILTLTLLKNPRLCGGSSFDKPSRAAMAENLSRLVKSRLKKIHSIPSATYPLFPVALWWAR